MADFTFVTSNDHKVQVAQIICDQFGIAFQRKHLDLLEIQSDDGAAIAALKIEQAFEACKGPVVITDSSWLIPGLQGFPGPYMKQINHWFTPQDFLHLTAPLTDRRITYRQILAYKDSSIKKLFSVDIEGVLLKGARGESVFPTYPIISFDGGHKSLAEADTSGLPAIAEHHTAWHELCMWLQAKS